MIGIIFLMITFSAIFQKSDKSIVTPIGKLKLKQVYPLASVFKKQESPFRTLHILQIFTSLLVFLTCFQIFSINNNYLSAGAYGLLTTQAYTIPALVANFYSISRSKRISAGIFLCEF